MDIVTKRLTPTSDTVRRLYLLSGNQCAFPECNHPIIVEDGTYVGELCHICAAEVGGERFDPTQSNEERRQFNNLMLMCHDHHVVTNDVVAYTIERMRRMKADHEQRFEHGLASMMESASVQITDSNISLGGEGGNAPGAGGGGGGAIGPGAIGGAGGAGGEYKEGIFDIDEDVIGVRLHAGRGGQGETDSNPRTDGGDSFAEFIYRDGSVREVLRAKGGKHVPFGTGSIQVKVAMLANSAEVREGLLFALGAGWSSFTVESFPAVLIFDVFYIAESDSDSHGTIITSVINPHNNIVATNSQLFDLSNGRVPFAAKVIVTAEEIGLWRVVLTCNEQELWCLPFEVRLAENAKTESSQ